MTTTQLNEYLAGRKIYTGTYLYHREKRLKAKVTSLKVWKKLIDFYTETGETHPRFRIGLKHGLYDCGELTNFYDLHTKWLSAFEWNSLTGKEQI